MARRLGRRFFARSSETVARALLGKRLVHGDRSGIIVETEAYLGEVDAASHARFGPTKRNAPMFGRAGRSYVYLCYGMYELFNIVTGAEGDGQAVLIRGVAVDEAAAEVGRGPGKLSRALGIDRSHNEVDLITSKELYVTTGTRVDADAVVTSPRIGVDYAGEWAQEPLRYFIRNHPAVSGKRHRRA